MGSGTSVGEAVKLGCRVIGKDINPVSMMMVKAALQNYRKEDVISIYDQIEKAARKQIQTFYKTELATGEEVDILYYFWVKITKCPKCSSEIDLFRNRIFAKNAYPNKHPEAKSLCPTCHTINNVLYTDTNIKCYQCHKKYNPHQGNVHKSKVICPICDFAFSLIDVMKKSSTPLLHRMYAKLILHKNGKKSYEPIQRSDIDSYNTSGEKIYELQSLIPRVEIKPGYNTNQILKYNYKYWHQTFNHRQLVCLAILLTEIRKIQSLELRTLFACLFSGMLEFNNMFTSFKGEGTGAVRHMFSHHILKTELNPIEGNVWGTPKSSGSFSSLFRTRILRILEYKENPFELKISNLNKNNQKTKVCGLSKPINSKLVYNYQSFLSNCDSVYLASGDSSHTDIDDASVDLVITDPPFFDNIHYSELADFFYVWLIQAIKIDKISRSRLTTRSPDEVQSTSQKDFSRKLEAVFTECYRVLKENGLLVFTHHHSRSQGWLALYKAIRQAGFFVSITYPIKSEMSVAIPIRQSNKPINYDLILVCKKDKTMSPDNAKYETMSLSYSNIVNEAKHMIDELRAASLKVSSGDIRMILIGSILKDLQKIGDPSKEEMALNDFEQQINLLAEGLESM